jgi:hypothetical protein
VRSAPAASWSWRLAAAAIPRSPPDLRSSAPNAPRTPARRRSPLFALGGVVVLFLLLVAWLGVTAYLARKHLLAARSEVSRLQNDVSNGRTDRLTSGLTSVRHDAKSAHRLTSDPVWWVAGHVPVLGHTFETTSGLAKATDQVAGTALPPLVDAATDLDPAKVRRADGSLDLARLTAASPHLEQADAALGVARTAVDKLPITGLVGPVATARRQLDDQLRNLSGSLDDATRAAKIGPAMLGASGTRRYLVMFQNPAEARGTGGLTGSFAVIRAQNGKLTRERTGSDSDLLDSPTPVVDLGPEFNARWGAAQAALGWRNANVTPHYPWAANIWQKLWEKQSGQQIDGVIAVDPIALGYLLKVTGPLTLSDGEVLRSSNIATWALSTEYVKYSTDNDRRKKLLTELSQKSFDRVNSGAGHSAALLRALGTAAGQHRLLLWSAHPEEESAVLGTPLAGTVLDENGPMGALILNNAAGNKLDYYVDRKLDYDVNSCGSTSRTVRATITLKNTAPAGGLPGIVDTRSDHLPSTPGQSRTFVNYYATVDAKLTGAALDGKHVDLVIGVERGHPAFSADVEIRAGQSRTLVLEYTEPASKQPVVIPVQPLARPMTVDIADRCH